MSCDCDHKLDTNASSHTSNTFNNNIVLVSRGANIGHVVKYMQNRFNYIIIHIKSTKIVATRHVSCARNVPKMLLRRFWARLLQLLYSTLLMIIAAGEGQRMEGMYQKFLLTRYGGADSPIQSLNMIDIDACEGRWKCRTWQFNNCQFWSVSVRSCIVRPLVIRGPFLSGLAFSFFWRRERQNLCTYILRPIIS